ncbi:META domain-containing protein [Roseateles amylovorans]|jgi:heat shock protein HslJ|uniref:META domain-containing protein n=1 Tax=Roseateles amylovorans TaxID=2978473 RepID=A0ABY6B3W6_9BURK|nr:META domain-containing protein [Roseateles amylovorans]UXH79624.1 META domain-containing protein [Roseateles amylovorans]
MHPSRFVGPLLILALVAGCAAPSASSSASGSASSATSSSTARPLPADGPSLHRWSDQSWEVASLGSRDLPENGPRPTLQVVDGMAQGTDGCNRYRQAITTPADVPGALRFNPSGAATTRMACVPPGDAIARDWHAALAATRSIRAERSRLLLIDEGDNVLARLRPQAKAGATP